MELDHYITEVRRQLAVTAEAAGDDARALAERLSATLDATLRLILLEALGVAAAEITRELAPGSVDLRLRGREPEFVVTPAPIEDPEQEAPVVADDTAMTRINLRLPDQLKNRIEQAAERDGLSINAWLVRAAATAVERRPQSARAPHGGQQLRGWVR